VQASLSARIALGVAAVRDRDRPAGREVLAVPEPAHDREGPRGPGAGRTAGMDDEAEHRWKWFEVGPGELQGEFEIVPEGGSMAARNVPQDRQDAGIFLNQLMQNPYIDPKRPLMRAWSCWGSGTRSRG
jgi:hypothetical protein